MYIKNINRLDWGVFRDFQWPASLTGFSKHTIIFGWNGSGKTTISRALRSLELEEVSLNDETFSIHLKEGSPLNEFNRGVKGIYVFNKDFIDDVVFAKNQEAGMPVLVYVGIGVTSAEEEVLLLQQNLERIARSKQDKERKRAGLVNDKDVMERQMAKVIKEAIYLHSASTRYKYFNVTNFRDFLEDMKEGMPEQDHRAYINGFLLDDSQRTEYLQLVKGSQELQPVIFRLKDLQTKLTDAKILEMNGLLGQRVERISIDELENDPYLSGWVKGGITLHKALQPCGFCGQTVSQIRLDQLHGHFNNQYQLFVKDLEAVIENLMVIDISKTLDNTLLKRCEDINERIKSFHALIRQKIDFIDKDLSKNNLLQELGSQVAQTLDLRILTSVGESPEVIKDKIAKSYIAEVFFKHAGLEEKITLTNNQFDEIAEEEDAKKQLLRDKTAEIQNTLAPINDLNKYLAGILGHGEISIELIEDSEGYHIVRHDGSRAEKISEGEKTAIAVAYFLIKLNDRNADLAKSCVVFDDPISSLDLNALYRIHSLTVGVARKSEQTIFLTHNFDFFNLLKREFIKNDSESGSIFMLKLLVKNNLRCSSITSIDKVLERFDSEYQYLFKLLNDFNDKQGAEKESIQTIFPYPNIARRFLEIYLSFQYPNLRDYGNKLKNGNAKRFDEAKINAIYNFTNDQSHGPTDSMGRFNPQLIAPSAKDAISLVLEFIEHDNEKHYKDLLKSIK